MNLRPQWLIADIIRGPVQRIMERTQPLDNQELLMGQVHFSDGNHPAAVRRAEAMFHRNNDSGRW